MNSSGNWLKRLSDKRRKTKSNVSASVGTKSFEQYRFGQTSVKASTSKGKAAATAVISESDSDSDSDFADVSKRRVKSQHRLVRDRVLKRIADNGQDQEKLTAEKKVKHAKDDKHKKTSHSLLCAVREDHNLQYLEGSEHKCDSFFTRRCISYTQYHKQRQGEGPSSLHERMNLHCTENLLEYDFQCLGAQLKAVLLRPPLQDSEKMNFNRLSNLLGSICLNMKSGLLFIWVEKEHIPMAIRCMACWSFRYVENLTWIKLDSNCQPCYNHSRYFKSSHMTLLIGRREKDKKVSWF